MFSEKERLIFQYANWDNSPRFADPQVVRRELVRQSGGEIDAILKDSVRPDNVDLEGEAALKVENAEVRLVEIVRAVFDLMPFDPESRAGYTEAMVWMVWSAWQEWLEKNENSAGN